MVVGSYNIIQNTSVMRQIISFFRNLFKSKEISRNEILAFAAYQLAAMIEANPEGILDDRITETTTALNAMQGVTSDEGGKLAIQKVRTNAKKAFRRALTTQVATYYGLVQGQFGADSAVVLECFPKGRSVFTNCREAQLAKELKTLADGLAHHANVLPAPAVAAATALGATWAGLLGNQTSALTEHAAQADQIDAAQAGLARALFRNVLWIGYHFADDEAKCMFYNPQHLLENRASAVTPGPATLLAGPFDAVTKKTVFTITAENAATFSLWRRLMGEAEFTVIAEDIEPVNGTGTYTDTMPAAGTYEYVAMGYNGTRVGEQSGIVTVVQE